jgi:hypothetical protein
MKLWFLIAALLAINVPAFLCMGLDHDAMQFDLLAHAAMDGRALYRDAAEVNLPGMVLPHVLVRSLLGWRSEALRLADLLIVFAICWQLTRWLPSNATRTHRLGLAGLLLAFYLSLSEWCHCQRDVWMMVPALAALSFRLTQTSRLSNPVSSSRPILWAGIAEGILWAAAFWIKPFVAVPGLCCWILSIWLTGRSQSRRAWMPVVDGSAVLVGGLVTGAAGIGWLMATGAWPSFVEVMIVWNREYAAHDVTEGQYWLCVLGLSFRFFPWILIHLVAVPLAVGHIWRAATRFGCTSEFFQLGDPIAQTLFAAFYLGWLIQSIVLQHLFDYVNTPPVLLGLTVVASWAVATNQLAAKRLIVAFCFVCLIFRFPTICMDRLSVWGECLTEGTTPALRDRLTLLPRVNWSDLEHMKDFLGQQDLKDGELSCMNMGAIGLYGDLHVTPATRFHILQPYFVMLPRQRSTIDRDFSASRQRFMVCDVEGFGMERLRDALQEGTAPSPGTSASDFRSYPIVFRAGRYVVFQLSGQQTSHWVDSILN